MALRAPADADFKALGEPVMAEVEATRQAMRAFAEGVRSGSITGSTGKPFTAVMHIGIGGSDLGPHLVWEALRPLEPAITLRFVANVDGADIAAATAGLDPATTLVIAVSKSFATAETLANAHAARDWIVAGLGEGAGERHMAAVSVNIPAVTAFGIPEDRIFGFRDWVGGRFSLWSAVGLSCAIGLGWDVFQRLLDGAWAMDTHFRSAPLERNAPVLLALAHIYNRDGLGRPSRGVIPYARRLALLPGFLQQLEMESNGKHVTPLGAATKQGTASVVFGDVGANAQHAFFQFLHQGSEVVPIDFVAVAKADEGPPGFQEKLLANAVAQAEALMTGRPTGPDANILARQKDYPGDRPSSFILMERLTPQALGALIALYEHKVFVEGVLWGINSFDQWGVELGKTLAETIEAELKGGPAQPHDPSTAALIARLKR
jgi:glucose-6-phosphate isomerase